MNAHTFYQRTLDNAAKELDFVAAAADSFSKNPKQATFGDITPGGLLAVRWGFSDDCIVLVHISEDQPIINYVQSIDK